MGWYHQPDVNAGESCRSHSEEDGLSGKKIGCFHVDIVLGFKQNAHIALHDVGPLGDGTTRHNLGESRWVLGVGCWVLGVRC